MYWSANLQDSELIFRPSWPNGKSKKNSVVDIVAGFTNKSFFVLSVEMMICKILYSLLVAGHLG